MGRELKEEIKGKRLKNGILVRERVRKSTPSPTWRFHLEEDNTTTSCSQLVQDRTAITVSARKIGACFWESQSQVKIMSKGGGGGGGGGSRIRHQQQQRREESYGKEEMGFDQGVDNLFDERRHSPPLLPESPSSLRRRVTASLIQHHPSVERNGKNLQHVSPASYCSSSFEAAAHNGAVTPASSLDFSGRVRGASAPLKSSTELLKILNRIWSLEEHQASNLSLIEALTRERDLSKTQMKELLQGRKRDQQEIERLRKQVYSVESVRDELEDERRLRKHSESLHRKLARELSEAKSSILNALKDLEREKRARILLENLCDEFAKGIRDYEQDQRLSKQKVKKDLANKIDHHDRLILHVSEAWLDERTQMKLAEARCDDSERSTIVDKLSYEIETFLQAKQKTSFFPEINDDVSSKKTKENRLRRHSMESFNLNEAGNATKSGIYGEESIDIGYCFELNHGSSGKQKNGSSKQTDAATQTLVKSDSAKNPVLRSKEAREENSAEAKTQFEKSDEAAVDQSTAAGNDTTVREWMSRITGENSEVLESSSRWPPGAKENTLKAKLLEARLENQQYRSRTVKGSF